MNKLGLLGIIVLISFTSFVVAEELFRMSGSNANPVISTITYLRYSPPKFAQNLTLRVNCTDDNNSIIFVNFSLKSPTNNSYINNLNGTQFGDYWNSTSMIINESGIWEYNITSDDNDDSNTSFSVSSGSFTITDVVSINLLTVQSVFNSTENRTFQFDIFTNTPEYLNFTVEHNLTGENFTFSFNSTYFLSNNTQHGYFNYTIKANDVASGNYTGNITIARKWPFNRTWVIPVSFEINSVYGNIELVTYPDYTFTSCGGDISTSYQAINTGNYPLSNCYPYLSIGGVKAGTSSSDGFNLAIGENKTIYITYVSYSGSTIELAYFNINCTTGSNGVDSLSTTPKLTFYPGTSCGSSPTSPPSGGGGGTMVVKQAPIDIKAINITKEMVENICGNEKCEEDIETPWDCPQDCAKKLCSFEDIFCVPIFQCGNWKYAWMTNTMIVLLSVSMVFFVYRSRKVGRLKND